MKKYLNNKDILKKEAFWRKMLNNNVITFKREQCADCGYSYPSNKGLPFCRFSKTPELEWKGKPGDWLTEIPICLSRTDNPDPDLMFSC